MEKLKRMYNNSIDLIEKFLEKIEVFTVKVVHKAKTLYMKLLKKYGFKKIILTGLIFLFLLSGAFIIWVSTFSLPDLDNFEERKVSQSTKIYDRTGEIVLFDVHKDIKRTVVPYEEISDYVKKATISIEDENFYNHNGIEPKAILRAILTNLKDGNLLGGQGGSTITQQVIKNALLTSDKKISRKVKEWVLAPRLESKLTKDEILNIYLNEVPYGGTVYGVQEASRRFFAKDAKDLTLAESAYLAALPQAPTYYSPYGNNIERLESRKNTVLSKMLENGFISKEEYESAKNEDVQFEKPDDFGIKAPHFVMYIREILEEKYGTELVEQGGLKVTTTLDWELQEKAEEIAKRWAFQNKESFDAENTALVAIDPNNGQILTMVGSRDYFDEEIDGNFNVATAKRQPGSSFKPFVYAEAFNKGYRPETVVFDLPTEFSTACSSGGNCYSPVNYDGTFKGPISLRDALGQSRNVPAVKVLYLAGLKDSLELAKKMGIESLGDAKQYGLTLVLGGGEVTPLDMASAYGVFAADGIKNEKTGILKIEDRSGNVLEEFDEGKRGTRVLPEQTARLISSVLSDNVARSPVFGSNSYLNFPGRVVAAKTGTTNDFRDAWIVGYTPVISVSAWAGNNDNRSMANKSSSTIITPMWHEFMEIVLNDEKYKSGNFNQPAPIDKNIKPILAGFWKGENIEVIDKETGKPATNTTPEENKQTITTRGGSGVHSILHYVDIYNPLGPSPNNPNNDPQYSMWESSVRSWAEKQNISLDDNTQSSEIKKLTLLSPENNKDYLKDRELVVAVDIPGAKISSGEVYLNDVLIGTIDPISASYTFIPQEISNIKNSGNNLLVVVVDTLGNSYEKRLTFGIK